MSEQSQADTVAFLSRPETYGCDGPVKHIETHISEVFLAGDCVYKLKRAVRFPYLDYSTPALRRKFCDREVAVNRRTAPDLYEGVIPVTREQDGGLALDGVGQPVDWLVVMRRFDQQALWGAMARAGKLTPAHADSLADRIAAFHESVDVFVDSDGHTALREVIESENDPELRRFAPSVFDVEKIDRLSALCADRLDGLSARLDARAADGRVRHCHGDMHLDNICQLADGPVPFDAIEFSDDFARIDVLYDLAFPLMGLEMYGLRTLSNRLFNRYLSATRDYDGIAAFPLFMSLRAAIRAHVTAARAADAEERDVRREAEDRARRYLDFALLAQETRPPRLIAAGGLSGTGKSYLCRAVVGRPDFLPPPGAVHLLSDVIRKRLAGVAPEMRLAETWYRKDVTDRVHATMADQARRSLAAGYSVVLDATFMDPSRRAETASLAAEAGVRFDGFWLDAPAAVLESRVVGRTGDASDAGVQVLHSQLNADLGEIDWHRIDAGGTVADTFDATVAVLDGNNG